MKQAGFLGDLLLYSEDGSPPPNRRLIFTAIYVGISYKIQIIIVIAVGTLNPTINRYCCYGIIQ
jgi:hypothetical protein